jgi:hypothetical protein
VAALTRSVRHALRSMSIPRRVILNAKFVVLCPGGVPEPLVDLPVGNQRPKTHGKVENGLYDDISPFSEAIQQCSECCRGALSEARA